MNLSDLEFQWDKKMPCNCHPKETKMPFILRTSLSFKTPVKMNFVVLKYNYTLRVTEVLILL